MMPTPPSNAIQYLLGCVNPAFPNLQQVYEKNPGVEKISLAHTLKDHLYQCPSKLSEDLVRCMAAIYCWLHSVASTKPEKNRSPLLSRSSTRDWSCKSVVEIPWISTDKNQCFHASYAINNYRVLVEQLERVNVSQIGGNAQMAFWINVYNSLIMHAYLAYGIPHGSVRRMALFHKATYNIGGHAISTDVIEQSIFRFRTPRIGRWFETILSAAMRKKAGEERQLLYSKLGLQSSQPLICFALCTGASSDPVVHRESLSQSNQEYILVTTELDKKGSPVHETPTNAGSGEG
uniref:DUF547 domain-containing protein n=1 Tax=Nelumbo nucifera TaxID=4432 RepID=A0A822XLS2_NELNU|nr:TPA_asm: hypothetical protein HUJ06_019941 [Nelumbo nucifera]